MKNKQIQKLAFSAVMLALAFVLSYIQLFHLPWGGSVTLLSALPICIVSIKYGIGWGLGAGFCFAWLQLLQSGGEIFTWGLTAFMAFCSLMLDYIVPFTGLGLAGILRKRGDAGIILGVTASLVLRFISHFCSGYFIFANMEEFVVFGESFVGRPALYSLLYNGAYMLPETVITVIGATVVLCLPQLKKLIKPE